MIGSILGADESGVVNYFLLSPTTPMYSRSASVAWLQIPLVYL